MLPESWDESKTVCKGDVVGFKIEEGEGKKKVLSSRLPPTFPAPSPLIFSLAFKDGGRDQRTSEFPLKNACSTG